MMQRYTARKGMEEDRELKLLERELKLRAYTPRTLDAYKLYVGLYKEYVKERDLQEDVESVKDFLAYLIGEKNYKATSIAMVKAALIFYFENVKGIHINAKQLATPKKSKKLPIVLSKEEVKRLFDAADSEKKKLILMVLYATGLRVSELINLKIKDIDFDEGVIKVVGGKGKKDRVVTVSGKLLQRLKEYVKTKSPEEYVFVSKYGNKLSSRYIQYLVKDLSLAAGITKDVTPHVLRHSYATHLLESGANIRVIQELLGHANLQTTQIYTKVSLSELKKVTNPFDNL